MNVLSMLHAFLPCWDYQGISESVHGGLLFRVTGVPEAIREIVALCSSKDGLNKAAGWLTFSSHGILKLQFYVLEHTLAV